MKPTLLVLAAGMGSRYGGVKQIEPVGEKGEIILEYSVFDALRSGFGKVVFVIRKDIEKDFNDHVLPRFSRHIPCSYVFQEMDDIPDLCEVSPDRTKPWGTAHAVYAARHMVKEPFAVINADDFYGRDAFRVMGDFLSGLDRDDSRYCLVAYRLKNTVSENGTVSRGICQVDEKGFLTGMEEHTKLEKRSRDIASHLPDGSIREFTGEELVSMNLFGFTPLILPKIELMFTEFLGEKGDDPKAEFYIPAVANRVVAEEGSSMQVLHSDASWFGITYKEDRPGVVEAIRSLVEAGEYPAGLWS